MHSRQSWIGFILLWTVLTAVAWFTVGVLGSFSPGPEQFGMLGVNATTQDLWLSTALLTGMGAVVGLLQWIPLHNRLDRAFRWPLATVGGCLTGALLGFFLTGSGWLGALAFTALAVANLQALVLWPDTRSGLLWAVGKLAAILPTTLLGLVGLFLTVGFLGAEPWSSGLFLLPFGLAFGLFTGGLMAWTLARQERAAEQPAPARLKTA